MSLDVEKVIREYIEGVVHLSLGTSSNNRPWVCEVHFAYDDELNLYFLSTLARRHSQEIAANPFVAGNIVEQHELGEKPRGVYFEGTAELLDNVDTSHPAYKVYNDRLGKGDWVKDEIVKPGGARLYKITVANFYLFDVRESVPANKYHLPWKEQNL
jgi:uncharacterized protein YhbP (UPF0306 family)